MDGIKEITFINGLRLVIALATLYLVALGARKCYYYVVYWSKLPGPTLSKLTSYPLCRSILSSRNPFDMLQLHEKYGPVVQIAPNEVSFCSPESWQAIYGATKGVPNSVFMKSDFYNAFATHGFSIVSERNPEKHREMHRYLSPAFSDRSLKQQEYLIAGVIDSFVQRIGEAPDASVNLTKWYNLMTFDIIGELAFGKSFDGVSTGETHSWVAVVMAAMRESSLADTFRRLPVLGIAYIIFHPGWLRKLTKGASDNAEYARSAIRERKSQGSTRKDFMTQLLDSSSRAEHQISDNQLAAHTNDLVFAGSETTATTLTAVTWYLARNPSLMTKLRAEIDTSFTHYADINFTSASKLTYLRAACLEALRLYPPLPIGLPRVVPKTGAVIDGFAIPGGTIVSTHAFAASLSPQNFKDPWVFDPERWLTENPSDRLEASQPFSLGPRVCLGRTLAWVELYTTLAKLYFRYEVELVDTEMDWHERSEMYLFWKKPALMVRLRERGGAKGS